MEEGLPPPKFVYRYFNDEAHAQRLLDGVVWLSTIEHCRKTDEIRQSDPEEATSTWFIEKLDPNMEPELLERANRALDRYGSRMSNCSDVRLVLMVPNGFMFCTSLEPGLTSFGGHCVRIAEPARFYSEVSKALLAVHTFDRQGFAPMTYGEREVGGFDGHPTDPMLLGPPGNAPEREARMYWVPKAGTIIERMEISVPPVRELCTLIVAKDAR